MPPPNSDFDQIATTTLRRYEKTLSDNIFQSTPLLYFMLSESPIPTKYRNKSLTPKKVLSGGRTLVEPLIYAKNETVMMYTRAQELNIDPQDVLTSAEYQWKQMSGAVTIPGIDIRNNKNDKAKIINLVGAQVEVLRLSMLEKLSTQMYGTEANSKDITGLGKIIADNPLIGSVGGINRATAGNEFWRNKYLNGSVVKSSVAYDLLLRYVRNMYNNCSQGADRPDILISDQDTHEAYESLLVANQRYMSSDTGDGSFDMLKFKKAVWTWDDFCGEGEDTGRLYIINSRHLKWNVHEDADFSFSDFVKPDKQDVKTSTSLLQANLTCSNCKRQGVIYNMEKP